MNDFHTSPHQGKDQEATLINFCPGPDGNCLSVSQHHQASKKLNDKDNADLLYTPRLPSVALPDQSKRF
jgi:hypothetical protein